MSENVSQNNGGSAEGAATPVTDKNVPMAILAYIGPLVIVSYIVGKDDPFVKFHIKQGLILLVIEVALWVLSSMFFYQLYMLMNVAHLAVLVFVVLGVINAAKGEEKELPFIGQFSKYFNF